MKLYLNSILYLIMNNNEEDYILEEGVLQVLWAFCYNSNYSDESIKYYYDTLKEFFSNTIIYIKVDDNILIDRLLKRNTPGGSELEHDLKKDTMSFKRARNIEDTIILILQKKLNMDVVKL